VTENKTKQKPSAKLSKGAPLPASSLKRGPRRPYLVRLP